VLWAFILPVFVALKQVTMALGSCQTAQAQASYTMAAFELRELQEENDK